MCWKNGRIVAKQNVNKVLYWISYQFIFFEFWRNASCNQGRMLWPYDERLLMVLYIQCVSGVSHDHSTRSFRFEWVLIVVTLIRVMQFIFVFRNLLLNIVRKIGLAVGFDKKIQTWIIEFYNLVFHCLTFRIAIKMDQVSLENSNCAREHVRHTLK